MKKLKLSVEDLAVDSCDLGAIDETLGTVHGASDGPYSNDCRSGDYIRYVTSTWMSEWC